MYMDLRAAAREIFLEAMHAVDLRSVLRRKVQAVDGRLAIGSAQYSLASFDRILLVAAGKAALPMAEALLQALDPLLGPGHVLRGIVIGTALPTQPDARLTFRMGSHPLPDESAVVAARNIQELLRTADDRTLVFFLVSGGASAMVELPVIPQLSLGDMIAFHKALVHSGLSIVEMNTLRKHLSAVKGGRLAVAAMPATQCTLLVSDVPPGPSEVIGSGLSMPDPTTLSDCRELVRTRLDDGALPAAVRELFTSGALPETPKPQHRAFDRATFHTLLSSADLCDAAQTAAAARGFITAMNLSCDEWDYRDAAHLLLTQLASSEPERPFCLISAGELSVPIQGVPGTGGRNQQFALECARRLAGAARASVVLSAGSDGVDGNSAAAGAIVDTTTASRALAQGFSMDQALAHYDAYPLLHAIGDSVVTGPTGNNLRDLRVLLMQA